MPTVQVEIKISDVQVGDVLVGLVPSNGGANIIWGQPTPYTVVAGNQPPRGTTAGIQWWKDAYGNGLYKSFLALRELVTTQPLYQGTFPVTPATPKKVKDWPLDCPRCHRRESAYLGMNQYDCKHGCYK